MCPVAEFTERESTEPARPIAFEEERRTIDYSYKADETTANLCAACHSIARVLSERRTKEEWQLLVAMHRGYYPLVDNQPMNGGQSFMRSGGRGARGGESRRQAQNESALDERPPDDRHPIERALEHLEKALPLTTPEWSAWAAAMQAPRLGGRWAVVGTQTGKGPIFGQVTVTPDPSAPDTFTTEIHYTIARGGETISRSGKALVYTGYQWRGRANDWREVLFVERDRRQMWGRWFTGAYDETGIDVTLTRMSTDPMLFGASVSAVKTGSTGQNVRDKIDAIRVVPQSGMARVGGAVFPKQLQQFEAIGISYGPDGKPDTADDLDLGIVSVKWSLEEYPATFTDDDIQYVGTLDQSGLFTPNLDGPNPKRPGNRNNVGDVWVVAEYTGAKPIRGRAHLLVTVPVYMNWFADESK